MHERDKNSVQNFNRNDPKGRDLFGILDVHGRKLLKWMLRKRLRNMWIGFIMFRVRSTEEVSQTLQ
jgi:hypothetical protein